MLGTVLCGTILPGRASGQTPQLDPDLVRARCRTVHDIEDQSILYGFVVDAGTGLPLPGGSVRLSWVTIRGVGDSTVHSASADAADGAYIFCDVPQETRLAAWAEALGQSGGRAEFFFHGGESHRHDITLDFVHGVGGISGRLLDATTGEPIESATVRIASLDVSALSDRNGRFRFSEVPVGTHEAEIRHVTYGAPTLRLSVELSQTTHAEIRLDPQPIAVEPISVEVTRRVRWLENNGFYDRVERKLGQFVTPEQLQLRSWRRLSEVLRDVPGLQVLTLCTPRCTQSIRMAGTTQTGCSPVFYVDGRRIQMQSSPRSRFQPPGQLDLDALVTGSDIQAVEVYRSIAETPPQFYGRCGAIVLWTRRGIG